MISVVVDTNVLVSGFVRRNTQSPTVLVIDAWRARIFVLVVSEHILDELERTFLEPYFASRLTPEQRTANITLIREEAIITPITSEVHGIATHPEDDLILATAVSAQVDYLVTGDTKLQDLGSYQGVVILSPREFLELLTAERIKKG